MQLELPLWGKGETLIPQRSVETQPAVNGNERSGNDHLMERVIEGRNVLKAMKRVMQNKGSPGVDGMNVEELPEHLQQNWEILRAEMLAGTYQPQPVRGVEIPKSGGGLRKLGIPTVLDRLIQQCILQVFQPMIDPIFSEHSYGFRPGRSAHEAVCEAQRYIQEGKHVVVDVDLEKFFDRVNHDVLMGRLAKKVGDQRVLRIIRRYLEVGVMADGVTTERYEGTPQGGPLSPLLANVLLDEVDKELEKRGLSFVRYADDLNIYVRSMRAGEDAMQTLKRLYSRLKLRINESKSAVARCWERKFLGYSFWTTTVGCRVKLCVASKALEAMKTRIREITNRNCGRDMESIFRALRSYLPGWKEYFRLAETPETFRRLDGWIRHRLRAVQLKQWKHGTKVYPELRARGVSDRYARAAATHVRRWWRTSTHGAINTALPMSYYDRMKIPRLAT